VLRGVLPERELALLGQHRGQALHGRRRTGAELGRLDADDDVVARRDHLEQQHRRRCLGAHLPRHDEAAGEARS
jgi:hypothetical protein